MNNQHELTCLLALKSIQGIGNITALKLLAHFSCAANIFAASLNALQACKLKSKITDQIRHFDLDSMENVLAWAKQPERFIIPINSPLYPPLLAQINNPPMILFAIGNPEILLAPQIGVVGARSPSVQGITNTQNFCQSLCEHGITITSGLAMGIDGEAHRSALKCNGYTIAVTGTGLNRVYPAMHRELAHQIAQNGVLVSEKMPNENYDRGSFPQRNRIIAGLSLGTLVIEAAEKSGTLITANHSMEEGREVFAIPGSIHNPLSKGCHNLIKQGAKLVDTIEDILEDLPSISKGFQVFNEPKTISPLNEETAEFLKYIDYDITSIDTIIARSQLTVEAVTNKLLTLELEGWIINSAGGYIRQ